MPFLWHPYLYHYGTNARAPGEGLYTVRVRIAAPTFMRHDPCNGKRFAEPVQVAFGDRRFIPDRKPSPTPSPAAPTPATPAEARHPGNVAVPRHSVRVVQPPAGPAAVPGRSIVLSLFTLEVDRHAD